MPAASPSATACTAGTAGTVDGKFERWDLAAGAQSYGIVAGPDGALWFTSTSHDKLGRITTCGQLSDFPVAAGFHPTRLVVGPDQLLYATSGAGYGQGSLRQVVRMSLQGHATYITVDGAPTSVAAGPDQAVWVATDYATNSHEEIARIATDGSVKEVSLPANGQGAQCGWQCPDQITTGGDGALWFTEGLGQGGFGLGRLTTSGDYQHISPPDPTHNTPGPIATTSSGTVWYGVQRGSIVGKVNADQTVTEYKLPEADVMSTPDMAADREGGIWFLITRGQMGGPNSTDLGHIDSSGQVSVIPVPPLPPDNIANALTIGADGRVWITDGAAIFAYSP